MELIKLDRATKTLNTVVEEYYRTAFTERHADRTIELNRERLDRFVKFALLSPPSRTKDPRQYAANLQQLCQTWANLIIGKYSPWNARSHLSAVKRFFHWCRRAGYVQFNPCDDIKPPPLQKKQRVLFTQEDYELMKKRAGKSMLKNILIIAWHTGLTLGDCCLLRWEHVDLDNLVIRKVRQKMKHTGNTAIIPIVPGSELHEHLLDLHANQVDYFVDGFQNGYVDPLMALRYRKSGHNVRRLCLHFFRDRMGYPRGRNFTAIRHTFISNLANSGCNTSLGCIISGHSKPQTFNSYVNPDLNAMRNQLAKAMEYGESNSKTKNTITIKKK